MSQAVRAACEYVEAGIRTSSDLGKGSGPINHFHSSYTMPFAPLVRLPSSEQSRQLINTFSGHFIDYLLAREDIQTAWRQHTEHAFVAGLADGSLPLKDFKHYLIQDYVYLVRTQLFVLNSLVDNSAQIHFARANALAAYKATSVDDINTVRACTYTASTWCCRYQ